jgi:hypothetical protein
MKPEKPRLWQAVGYLFCAFLTWKYSMPLEGSEFSGGRVTGRLLDLGDIGIALFVLSLLFVLVYRRVAAGVALVACLLCLPLYLYFIVPGPFRQVFKGNYSVPLRGNFVWDSWAFAGMFSLAIATYISLSAFNAGRPKSEH